MLDFFKKLFKGEEKEKVDFFEITKWLLPKMDMGLENDFQKIDEISKLLSDALDVLANIDIKSMQVEEKLKGFVSGNRKAYILSLNTFMRLLERPKELDSKSIIDYCDKLQKEMTIFSKKTTKNFYIMQNLIGKELEEIRKHLNELTNIIKSLSKKADKLKLIEDIFSRLKDIYAYLDEKQTRKQLLLESQKERDNLLKKEHQLKNKIEEFKQGNIYQELMDMKQKRTELETNIYSIKTKFTNKFASISRPLRKLAKMYMDKLLEKYLDEPFSALFEDKELEIDDLLNSLKKEMDSGKITEKNPDKILNALKEMDRAYLESVRDNYESKNKELEACNEAIEVNSFDIEMQAFADELKQIESRLAETEEKIENFKERAITRDIEKIEEDIRKLGFNIEIENAPYDSKVQS